MQDSLIEFMNKVEIINKDLAIYKDSEKGIEFVLNTVNLLARVDYLEVGTEKNARLKVAEYEKLLFEKKIEDLDYKKITKKDIRIKSEITGKKEDSTTLIEEEVPAVAIWNVSNGLGAKKSFTNKEEAMEYVEKNNKVILENLKSC